MVFLPCTKEINSLASVHQGVFSNKRFCMCQKLLRFQARYFLLNFSNSAGLRCDNGETLFSMSLYQCEPSLRQQGAPGFTSATHHNYLCTALIQHVRRQSQPHTEAPIKQGILQIKKYWFDWGLNRGGFPHLPCLIPPPFWKLNMPLHIRWNEGNQLSLGFWKTKKSLISSLDNQTLWSWIKKRAVVRAFDTTERTCISEHIFRHWCTGILLW